MFVNLFSQTMHNSSIRQQSGTIWFDLTQDLPQMKHMLYLKAMGACLIDLEIERDAIDW